MQGDIASPIYQTLLYVLSTMQGDIDYIGLKMIIYKFNLGNARWHRQSYISKFIICLISNARWHRIYWHKSPIYKSLLSAMQGDIEYTGIKLIIYNVNFSNARWHRQLYISKLTIHPISNASWHRTYWHEIIFLQAQF